MTARLNDDDRFSIEAALAEARVARPGATRAELVADLERGWCQAFGHEQGAAAAAWALRDVAPLPGTPALDHPGLETLAALVMHPHDLDVDADPLDTFDHIAPLLTVGARAALAEACDFCPVHECDTGICADDDDPGCDHGRGAHRNHGVLAGMECDE